MNTDLSGMILKNNLFYYPAIFFIVIGLSFCSGGDVEIQIPEEAVLMNEVYSESDYQKISVILINIDCGSCVEMTKVLKAVIEDLKNKKREPQIILYGESLDMFLSRFPNVIELEVPIYYDRYNRFKELNSLNVPGYPVIVTVSGKGMSFKPLSRVAR